MKKNIFLSVLAFFVIGCGGGGGTTDLPKEYPYDTPLNLPEGTTGLPTGYPYDTLLNIPEGATIQGATADTPTPLSPLSIPITLESLAVKHAFGADVSNNYFEYTALAGEVLQIAITFNVPLTSDEMLQLETASPGFLEVYDSQLDPAAITHEGGSKEFTEVYMVYAIKFVEAGTYLLQFGWEGHAGYATIASIAP